MKKNIDIKLKGWWWKRFFKKYRREKKFISSLINYNNKELQKKLPNTIFNYLKYGNGVHKDKYKNMTEKN